MKKNYLLGPALIALPLALGGCADRAVQPIPQPTEISLPGDIRHVELDPTAPAPPAPSVSPAPTDIAVPEIYQHVELEAKGAEPSSPPGETKQQPIGSAVAWTTHLTSDKLAWTMPEDWKVVPSDEGIDTPSWEVLDGQGREMVYLNGNVVTSTDGDTYSYNRTIIERTAHPTNLDADVVLLHFDATSQVTGEQATGVVLALVDRAALAAAGNEPSLDVFRSENGANWCWATAYTQNLDISPEMTVADTRKLIGTEPYETVKRVLLSVDTTGQGLSRFQS